MTATATDANPEQVRSTPPQVSSLDALVGVELDALRELYAAAEPFDSTVVGAARGLVLALASSPTLLRPAMRVWSRHLNPWKGMTFESGGTTGINRVLGFDAFRFRCEVAASELDGRPTLVMRYRGFGHPWPISNLVDELRTVGEGIAIGPSMIDVGSELRQVMWWGVSW